MRYYEIFLQTGRSIVEFHADSPSSFLGDYDIKTVILEPERSYLYDICNKRFEQMVANGAIEEVRNAKGLGDETVASKAIGFNELSSYLDGEISKEEAIILSQARTRQYAKRQMTWFRHQIEDALRVSFDGELPSIDRILKGVQYASN